MSHPAMSHPAHHPHPPNVFAAAPIDRADDRREDPAWLAARLEDPAAAAVVRVGERVWWSPEEGRATVPLACCRQLLAAEPPYLGELDGGPVFAADLTHVATEELEAALPPGRFAGLREVATAVDQGLAGVLAYASGLLTWHGYSRHCGACGQLTSVGRAGHVRRCEACGAEHFPRTDPAVIMLVTDGERALLGRRPRWPEPLRSVLAGFVEPGESLEDAVAREVREEVGVEVADVRYQSSQPWPFPSSLMLGFRATAVTTELRVDPAELADAAWYGRDAVGAALRGEGDGLAVPPPVSIAHRLLRDWALPAG